ncbi:MAG: c-type cytochrome [Rhodospirillaceae bacterium]|nr:c-type cytochrome [Rhodospirillaceae bacterium]
MDQAWVSDPDLIEQGRDLFRGSCRDCHGSRADQSALGQSRIVAELEAEEIVAALAEIRDYGDLSSMQNRIKSALSDDDIRALAAYIATLQDGPSQ